MKILRTFCLLFACCLLFAGCASNSPAVSAIMKHDVNGFKKVLESGVPPNFVEDHEGGYGHGKSLLAISFDAANNDISRVLLDRGVDFANSKGLYGTMIGTNRAYSEIPNFKSPISLFLEKGVDSNQKLDNGMSIIYAACLEPENIRVLISNGAHTNDLWIAPSKDDSLTPLSACLSETAVVKAEIKQIRQTLSSPYYSYDAAVDKSMRSEIDRNTRLLNRSIDSVLILLDSGANPNATLLVGGRTSPILNFAIDTGSLRIVRAMLDHGADPMAVSEPRKKSALHIAAEFGHDEIANLLINSALASAKKDRNGNHQFRSWLNGRFNNEMTALHFAAKSGSANLFQILINAGADASVKDNNGYTAQIYLDQKLEADRASKLAAQSAVDAKRREQSEAANASGFQWGKFTAMAAGAAISGIDKMSSDVQVKMATGIIQDSMAGHDGMGNTQAAINDAKASMGNGGNGGKSAGDPSNAADRKAKAKACANEYDGPNDDPQTDTYCKLAAYDACLHRAGITEGDQSGRASCHTLNELLEATGSKYTCRYCPYPF